MDALTLHAIDPVARFLEIYDHLGRDTAWWTDSAWLRFAAQAAVMRPADPAETARVIRAMADELQAKARWYEALATPFNLVVAATLVQISDTAEAFSAEVESARRLLREAGFHHDGMHQIAAILAMRVLSDGKAATRFDIDRIREIFQAMKSRNWWFTGAEDLPACALLARHPGSPPEIAGISNAVYQLLRSHDYRRGENLQAAANLLPLTNLSAAQAAERFMGLCEELEEHSIPAWSERYEAIAMIALLDHPPQRVQNRIDEISLELETLVPALLDDVNFTVSVDLAFLDLARFDRQMRRVADPAEIERVQDLIRLQRAISITLVAVPPTPLALGGGGWPIGI